MKPTVTTLKRRNMYGRRLPITYLATGASVEAESDTRAGAIALWEKRAERLLRENHARDPYTLLGWIDAREVWVLSPTQNGWQYRIYRANPAEYSGHQRYAGSASFGTEETSFEDARCTMQEAWWGAQGLKDVVDGIVGLCTDKRHFSCPRCSYPAISHAPYTCQNPTCRHVLADQEGATAPALHGLLGEPQPYGWGKTKESVAIEAATKLGVFQHVVVK